VHRQDDPFKPRAALVSRGGSRYVQRGRRVTRAGRATFCDFKLAR
jgi:hypothetical protein